MSLIDTENELNQFLKNGHIWKSIKIIRDLKNQKTIEALRILIKVESTPSIYPSINKEIKEAIILIIHRLSKDNDPGLPQILNEMNEIEDNEIRDVIKKASYNTPEKIIEYYIKSYKTYLETTDGMANKESGLERIKLFQEFLSLQNISKLDEDRIIELMEIPWTINRWSDYPYKAYEIMEKTKLEGLIIELAKLLYEDKLVEDRIDRFISLTSGFGMALTTEMLSFVYPKMFCMWGRKIADSVIYLDLAKSFPENAVKKPMKMTGLDYIKCNNQLLEIRNVLEENGIRDANSIDVCLFLENCLNK